MKKWICSALILLNFSLVAQESEWTRFLQNYISAFQRDHLSLTHFTPEEIASQANYMEKSAARALGIKEEEFRKVDPQAIETLLLLLQEGQPKVFLCSADYELRDEEVSLSPPLKRILRMRRMTQEPTLSWVSAVEWIGECIIWDYLKQKTNACFCLQSAENKKSIDPANFLAKLLGTCAQPTVIWNNLLYPTEDILPSEEILEIIPDGNLPWQESKVDALFGEGMFASLNREMKEELHRPLCTHTVFIVVTNEPQLESLSLLTEIKETHFAPLGMLVVTSERVVPFTQGIFTEPVLDTIETSSQSKNRVDSAGENENPQSEETPPEGEVSFLP